MAKKIKGTGVFVAQCYNCNVQYHNQYQCWSLHCFMPCGCLHALLSVLHCKILQL